MTSHQVQGALPVCLLTTTVTAHQDYRDNKLPNGIRVTVNGVVDPTFGHLAPNSLGGQSTATPSGLNTFGAAFVAAGRTWTTALCNADSDGDGQTNGQELGDPECVWTETTPATTPARTLHISHPGNADSTSSAIVASPTVVPTDPTTDAATPVPTDAATPVPTDAATPVPTTAPIVHVPKAARCELEATVGQTPEGKCTGNIQFLQATPSSKTKVTWQLSEECGAEDSKHGLHIHSGQGALAGKCADANGHFNPFNKGHGPRSGSTSTRHLGDLGNVEFKKSDGKLDQLKSAVGYGGYEGTFDDMLISLSGDNTIINRSVVVHAKEDTFQGSMGGAGDRIACCNIVSVSVGGLSSAGGVGSVLASAFIGLAAFAVMI